MSSASADGAKFVFIAVFSELVAMTRRGI
jgi:hypothetical protein